MCLQFTGIPALLKRRPKQPGDLAREATHRTSTITADYRQQGSSTVAVRLDTQAVTDSSSVGPTPSLHFLLFEIPLNVSFCSPRLVSAI